MAINAVINVFYAQTGQTAQANPSRHSPMGQQLFTADLSDQALPVLGIIR